MLIRNGLWHGYDQQMGEGDVLALTFNWDRQSASADWVRVRETIVRLVRDNHIAWLIEFNDEMPFVTSEGCRLLYDDPQIIAALDDIARDPSLDRIECVRRRIATFDAMTLPSPENDNGRGHTCASIISTFYMNRLEPALVAFIRRMETEFLAP